MIKKLFLISCVVLSIAALPQYAQNISEFVATASTPEPVAEKPLVQTVAKTPSRPVAHYATGYRAASIQMDKSGHFSADFRINGRNVRGLIDTGATYVAFNMSAARNLGLNLGTSDFKHQVNTANGNVKAALVVLDRMEVGSISVENVEAFVLEDKALSSFLVGMSFMSKVQSYRVVKDKLEMIN
ncbi:TIGR02281 family clan AA aspartic protease [Hoeflea sp. G2-23]|uniref:TIGR02281 family clan AA aspartic protease n=1 Tax=Hoeflea algicola TaxID=2983763 RepID=A0ABT3ZBL3_9HYPH|nr:TIGR02281 family clan AA aspartic protease [Hoeflea algicola]MCY0149188.1 TIGR02281 family clan AA aspartic protease [Hoeflea algicola]